MPDVTLNGIEFEIKGSTDAASSSIDKTIGKLTELNATLRGVNGVKTLSNSMSGLVKSLGEFVKIDMHKLTEAFVSLGVGAKGLQPLAEVAKDIASFAKGMTSLAKEADNLPDVATYLTDIADIDFSNVVEAADGFKAMANALRSLAAIQKAAGDGLKETAAVAEEAAEAAGGYLMGDPGHKWAEDMTSAVESVDSGFIDNMREITDTSGIDAAASAVKRFAEWIGSLRTHSDGIANTVHWLKKLAKIDFSNIKEASTGLSALGSMARFMSSVINAKPENLAMAADYLQKIASIDFSNIERAASGLRQIEASAKGISKVSSAVRDVGHSAKKSNSPLKNFLASIKRIAFYRILRGILKSITQSFQEGLTNAYQYSKMTGGALAQALDTVATKSLTMKNQLGAAFGTLLQAITPAIVGAIKLITSLAAAITRLIAIISGQGTWLKAKDVWTDWGEEAAGAGGKAKEALRYLAPFDELNRLPDDRKGGGGGGSSADWGDMFETVSTDETAGFLDNLTGAFKSIGEWFESKDWQDIGSKAWEGLKKVFSSEENGQSAAQAFMEALGAGFGALVGTAWGFLSSLAEDLIRDFGKNLKDYNGDGKLDSVDFLKAVLKTGGDIVTWVYDNLVKPFFDGFGKALTGDSSFDFTTWANNNVLNPLIRAWNTFASNIANPIIEGINTAIDTINEKFNTSIPHIPLIGEIEEIKTDSSTKLPAGITKDKNNKYTFGMEAGLNGIKDNVPAKDKTIGGVTAGLDGVKDNIPANKKTTSGWKAAVDNFMDKIGIKKKNVDGFTAGFKKRTLGGDVTAIVDGLTAQFDTAKDNILKDDKTFDTVANFTKRKNNLTKDDKAFETVAKFTSRTNELTKDQKTFSTKASFDSSENKLGTPTFSSLAKIDTYTVKETLKKDGYFSLSTKVNVVGQTGTPTLKAKVEFTGTSAKFANGGAFYGNAWHKIPQYANGGRVHGSMFIAGEAGAELVGHVGGRTEVLNQSQLAATMYAAVSNALHGLRMVISAPSASGSMNDSMMDEETMYRAFSRALADSDLGGDIELDGNTLYRAMVNRNRQNTRLTGVNAMA